ncbi:hypothetical protein F2Q69_00021670 [Brassica cretica]|uniref:Uncharacterized protein n=1 Tax=Brassica cretica TaxID=69181 RepID=A0A8S9QLI5_BRACR|nr:hypothetical protein F2Q69_00021670 [Brassica cretica]
MTLSLDLPDQKREAAQLRNWSYQNDVTTTYNKKVRTGTFQQGDWVLRRAEKTTEKLTPGWEGPYNSSRCGEQAPTGCKIGKDRREIIILKGAYELDQVSRDLRSWPTLAKSGTNTVACPQEQNGLRRIGIPRVPM